MHYRRTLELEPGHADAHNNLANVYREIGELENAIAHYRRALRSRPGHALARFNLGRALIEQGRVTEGLSEVKVAAKLEPEWPVSWWTLAWTLATHPADTVRDALEAIQFGERVAELTEYQHPAVLDALAAAYAENRQFDRAVELAQQGLDRATEIGDQDLAASIRTRLALYQRGEPYRAVPGR